MEFKELFTGESWFHHFSDEILAFMKISLDIK